MYIRQENHLELLHTTNETPIKPIKLRRTFSKLLNKRSNLTKDDFNLILETRGYSDQNCDAQLNISTFFTASYEFGLNLIHEL